MTPTSLMQSAVALPRRHRPATAAPILFVTALVLAYLIVSPSSVDLAAAEYRGWLFGRTGFAIWDLQWYGGHSLPAYSVLVPALTWLFGAHGLGALAVVAATALFQRLIRPSDARSRVAVAGFGVAVLASLLSGRITFTTGVPVALAALLVHERGRPGAVSATATLALSAATALFSPVASLFLAVVWAAQLLTRRRAWYVGALAATFAPILALNLAFPETGAEPFLASSLIVPFVVGAGLLAATRARRDAVNVGIVIYLAACVVTAMLHTPVGSNVLRLGPLVGATLLLLRVRPTGRGWRATAAVAILALGYWSCADGIRDLRSATGKPTVTAGYYAPLLRYLNRASGPAGEAAGDGFRVEIPFTNLHWEARWVAPHYAIARGWERQVDVEDNGLFYRPGLTAAAYDRWLHRSAVRFVALPRSPLDYSAVAERRVIDSGPRFLVPVWSDRDWRVYRVRHASPLVSGATLRGLSTDAVDLRMGATGRALLRVRFNPYWAVIGGAGCVSGAGERTWVRAAPGATVELGERFALSRVGATGPRCSG